VGAGAIFFSLLAAFCGGLTWIHDYELFAAAFAAAAVVAASQRARADTQAKEEWGNKKWQ
jgi:hypothetical protein